MLKRLLFAGAGLAGALLSSGAYAQEPSALTSSELPGVVDRAVPGWGKYFHFTLEADIDHHDHFSVAARDGYVNIAGNTPSALLSGAGWYLKYGAKRQVSPNGAPVAPAAGEMPPEFRASGRSSVIYRYALNQNTDGYTSPYWDWPHWEKELDIYALAGINTMLVERATEAVLAQTFAQFGYSNEDIRTTLAMPAHLNWQLMGNLCCFGGPPSKELLAQRIESTKTLLARMRAIGMTPVLPGYYGAVPADFKKRFPKAHVVNQGRWNAFQRPGWLDPRDPLFPRIAKAYYQAQRELFGDTTIYDLELFQEGGTAGNVPLKPAIEAIEASLQEAHPGARWMILGWADQPAAEILRVVPHDRMFVVDLYQNWTRRPDRGGDFLGAQYLFGGLWNYGGRTTLGGEAYDYGVRLPTLPSAQPSMIGTAIFPEGMDNNPYLFDLFSEAAWHDTPIDLPRWTRDFADRRYGKPDPYAQAAWVTLLNTVYSKQATTPYVRSSHDAAPIESLFDAQPSLTVHQDSSNGSPVVYYDFNALKAALRLLLQASASFDQSSAYRYDVVDVTRQVVANESRVLLPELAKAYAAKDEKTFESLSDTWLTLMDLQDQILGADPFFRVGRWLSFLDGWSHTSAEHDRLSYDARSLLTSWGDREISDTGNLHEYGNKEWQGLTHDYYRKRWQLFLGSLDDSLHSGLPPKSIDWYALADSWNRGTNPYSPQPEGNAREIAKHIVNIIDTIKTPDTRDARP